MQRAINEDFGYLDEGRGKGTRLLGYSLPNPGFFNSVEGLEFPTYYVNKYIIEMYDYFY